MNGKPSVGAPKQLYPYSDDPCSNSRKCSGPGVIQVRPDSDVGTIKVESGELQQIQSSRPDVLETAEVEIGLHAIDHNGRGRP